MIKNIFSLTSLLLSINTAYAAHITVSASENQTVDFQDFALSLNASNHQSGSSSLMTVTFQGELNTDPTENTTSIIIDGNDYGAFNNNSAEVYNVIAWANDSYLMSVDFFINSQSTENYLSDGRINIDVNFNDANYAAGENNDTSWANSPYAAVDFTYNQSAVVPVPATAWLFGSAILALAVIRRK